MKCAVVEPVMWCVVAGLLLTGCGKKPGRTMDSSPEDFKGSLLRAGVDKACEEIGLDFEALFLACAKGMDRNPYQEHKWIVMPHSAVKKGRVIHAIPPISQCDDVAWEEWFLLEGKLHHNILYTRKHDRCDGEFPGEADDKDHPGIVLGRKWYYYTDPDLVPLRCRK